MSTRANIKFQDGHEYIHVSRSHDGFPEVILPDIQAAVDLCKGRWSGAELGQLVTVFLGLHFDKTIRIQNYEPCIGYERAGDESYYYFVKWNEDNREYEYGISPR